MPKGKILQRFSGANAITFPIKSTSQIPISYNSSWNTIFHELFCPLLFGGFVGFRNQNDIIRQDSTCTPQPYKYPHLNFAAIQRRIPSSEYMSRAYGYINLYDKFRHDKTNIGILRRRLSPKRPHIQSCQAVISRGASCASSGSGSAIRAKSAKSLSRARSCV